jgi:hypothetical protein
MPEQPDRDEHEAAAGDRPDAEAPARAATRHERDRRYGQLHLIEQTEGSWAEQKPDVRTAYLTELKKDYFDVAGEFEKGSGDYGKAFLLFQRRYVLWRRALIVVTGTVAILNTIGAFLAAKQVPTDTSTSAWTQNFAVMVAVVAGMAAILSNLESFGKYLERSHGYREAREIFLDAFGEARALWAAYVMPFGEQPAACLNASRLVDWIQQRDREVRDQVKQLTAIKKPR